jgi:SAM-dependent methyltransferase
MSKPLLASLQKFPDTEKPVIVDYSDKDYTQFWTGTGKLFVYRFEQSILREVLSSVPGWFVDVGAGYGRLVPLYDRSDRQIVLVDYAVNLLEMATKRYSGQNVHFIAANAYHMPFRQGSFDSGISVRTFHHMNAPQSFLNELARIMHDGSTIVLSYSNKRNLLRLVKLGTHLQLGSWFRRNHEPYSSIQFGTHPMYFTGLCHNGGFSILTQRGTGFLERVVNKIPSLSMPLTLIEAATDQILGRLLLAPSQFAVLRKSNKSSSIQTELPKTLTDILACPVCHGSRLKIGAEITCSQCGAHFKKRGRILDLRYDGEVV